MQPLSPDEARWARSLGLLQKEGGYFSKANRRKAIWEIIGAVFILAVIGGLCVLAGVMQ